MAKGVKKIKKLSNSSISGDYYKSGDVICVNPNQEASFFVGEWYNETNEEERRNINWLWMDQNKIEKFKETRKPAGEPYGITLPKKLCGSYAYYLETSLYGGHDPRNTGVYVFGKCEKKITSSSWSKKRNAADNSEINYGQDLFITLETEGLNGDTLKLELYSQKESKLIDTIKENCTDGILKGKFKTISYSKFPGLPKSLENFYIKVIDIKGDYIKNANGNEKILSFNIIYNKSIIIIPVFEIPTNTAPLTIDVTPTEEIVKTEGIITAYFAKEEFTKETTEVDGKHEYKFANANIKYDKNKIAGIIKSKVDALVKADKKYAKLDDIKNALAEESYAKDTSITFNLCKLGAEYKKINGAPIEEEVYVVAKTFLLDGKEVTITIKEKEAIVVDADAAVPVLEAKEDGSELTTLKATVENSIAKLKVKLRPKADDALATWKEKLAGNRKDGTYKYTVKNAFTVSGDLEAIAASIEKKSNTSLSPNHIVKKEEIKSLLTEGTSYTTTNSFEIPKYKKEKITEMLWLKAECQGDTEKHEGEYLKKDGEYFVIGKGKEIIFPLLVKPENDTENKWGKGYFWAANQAANQATFNSNRGDGTRKHAGRDLYTTPEASVVAICKGEVLEVKSFYAQTDQVTILHETNDGRKFIIRYGELAPNSITVKKGDTVIQKQQIGLTGYLVGITVISGETIYMLHFEHYTGNKGYDLSTSLSTGDKPYMRRTDLVDSITILQEGYKNTFGDISLHQLFTIQDGKEALTQLYNKYKDQTWSWKWEGSEEEIIVSGKDLLTIVEKMYRLETDHFKSEQYQNCGTGGMESFGTAPHYGWDSTLFTKQPVGTWSAFEGKGLSGKGGNEQVTTKQKEFVKLPSVAVGMEYKINYIIKYEGNYARWYNTNTDKQEKYRESLKGVKARSIESL